MKRLFISQPMRGKTDEEILADREKAIADARRHLGDDADPLVIASYDRNANAAEKPLQFLAKAIELLASADVAYFAEGWEDARGCRIEHACAVEYGIDVIEGSR